MADAKQGKIPEDFYNGAQTRVVLAKPRLGGFGSLAASSSSKGCNTFGAVLRPSQLKPGSNPFLKVTEPTDEKDVSKEKSSDPPETDRLKESEEKPEPLKFVPLASTNAAPRTANPVPAPAQPAAASSSPGFVFGQNLSERVVMENMINGEATADHSSTNGTSELLFTSAASTVKENCQEEASGSSGPSNATGTQGAGEGLAAAAAAYERSHARPPPPAEHHSLTGEEGEINVLQISCRLFAWEAGSWRERGRGVLRLNDAAGGGARLVARVAGSLRVVLNTQLWPGMVVERAGTKSLRITAADAAQQIKLFLIMGAPADIVQLYRALTARIAVSKKTNCAQNASSQQAAERLEAATDDAEFLDKPATEPDSKDSNTDIKDSSKDSNTDMGDESEMKTETDRPLTEQKTEESQGEADPKALKRKEAVDSNSPPKRPCPDIVIQQ